MASHNDVERARRDGVLFGIPLGDLGWFQSLLMGVATGFAAFFAATFCAIVTLLVYFTVTHRPVDFAISYKRVGLPVGLVVGTIALLYLAIQWSRRMARRTRAS